MQVKFPTADKLGEGKAGVLLVKLLSWKRNIGNQKISLPYSKSACLITVSSFHVQCKTFTDVHTYTKCTQGSTKIFKLLPVPE